MVRQREQERQFWNAEDMAAYFAAKPADPRVVSFIHEKYPTGDGLNALDLGCGGGRHSEFLAQEGFTVTSVDPNPGMRSATEQRLVSRGLQAQVIEGEILKIPAEDQAFDLVVSTGVLHQANTAEEYKAAISELNRVMKVGSYACLNISTNTAWDDTYKVVSDDGLSVVTKEGLPMTLLPKDVFVAELADKGLALVLDYPEDIRQENTGQRSVYRANFQKQT